jgi:glucokinase
VATAVTYVLGFDIGGTHTRGALANLRGDIVAEAKVPTVKFDGRPGLGDLFKQLRDDLLAQSGIDPSNLKAAAAGVAGIIDPETGHVTMAPNISLVPSFDLTGIVGGALGLPSLVDNDVNMAAIGESRRGAARNSRNFLFLALGTGIGSGVFIEGKLYRGAHNAAGEIGYMYLHGVEPFEQGGVGAFERRAAGPAVTSAAARLFGERAPAPGHAPSPESLWAAAAEGDQHAINALQDVLDTLALGLANSALLLDPEMIVLGGGMSAAGDALLHPLRGRLAALLPEPVAPRLVLSELGSSAQMYGAIYSALDYVSDAAATSKGHVTID